MNESQVTSSSVASLIDCRCLEKSWSTPLDIDVQRQQKKLALQETGEACEIVRAVTSRASAKLTATTLEGMWRTTPLWSNAGAISGLNLQHFKSSTTLQYSSAFFESVTFWPQISVYDKNKRTGNWGSKGGERGATVGRCELDW